ncbi:hypothetical protein HY404_01705 [Candidatus Microgenomates bacterium]|nr:hypothetical protein [Candidatus Microgenomates bacterium]
MAKAYSANDVTTMRTEGVDLAPRIWQLVDDIAAKTSFLPEREFLRQSAWWKTGKVGAVHLPGILLQDGKETRAILKIQGTKPPTSEATMITEFSRQNKSKIIRPPHIYAHLPWNEIRQYEAIIMEEVKGQPAKDLDQFFNLYEEYRANCRNFPWVAKPQEYNYRERVSNWQAAVAEEVKRDHLGLSTDKELTEKAIKIIEDNTTVDDLEFVHGHFQPGDLIVTASGEAVLFSNLFWGWKNPFYDAVFGYHWRMLGMGGVENLTSEMLEAERQKWLSKIYNLAEVKKHHGGKHLIDLALLERAVPALMVDRYMLDADKLQTPLIVEAARKELKRLVSLFD